MKKNSMPKLTRPSDYNFFLLKKVRYLNLSPSLPLSLLSSAHKYTPFKNAVSKGKLSICTSGLFFK